MARIKLDKEDREQAIDGETVERVWDIKKIAVGLVVLGALFIVGSYLVLPSSGDKNSPQQTLGASTSSDVTPTVPPLPNKEDIGNIITSAKDTLSQLSADNLTSSQAAIQKVISDLQILQGNKSVGSAFCKLVCNNK